MRTVRLFAVALAGVALLGSSVLAQEESSIKPERRRVRRVRRDNQKDLYERLVKELDLTAEQQTQVKQIYETHRQAVENWRKENAEDSKALREQIAAARKEKDKETLKKLHQKMAKMGKQRRELQQAVHKQIAAVLTDEQKEKFEKMGRRVRRVVIGMRQIHAAMRGLKISEEQEQQIKKILADTRAAAAKVKTPPEKAALWQKAIKEIKTKVLTKEQAKKFEQNLRRLMLRVRVGAGLAALNLTDAQSEKIEKIRAKYREEIRNADREDRRELMKKMQEEINAVLTNEQKDQLKKQRERFRGPFAGLNLTDEQKEKIKNIQVGYREKIKNADREDRRELIKKMRDETNAVLTDEQKAQLKKQREEMRKRFRRRWGEEKPKPE